MGAALAGATAAAEPGGGADEPSEPQAATLSAIAAPLRRARRGVTGVAGTVASADAGSLTRSLLLVTGTATPEAQRPAYVERVNTELGSLSGAVVLPD